MATSQPSFPLDPRLAHAGQPTVPTMAPANIEDSIKHRIEAVREAIEERRGRPSKRLKKGYDVLSCI